MNSYRIPHDYIERVYAGWLGKVIGVRHGGNLENWSYEHIQKVFGEITHYVHQFKHFAADDDTNGPIFFLRALEDYTYTRDITPQQIGQTWMNYASDGHGFYWWGGYGKSTEHTAYLNMKHGIPAPVSGSILQNGTTVAEQIGGQIFIDVWGLIAPGQPELAAEYAGKAASVSHDGEGIYGGQFIAACIAAAFVEKDIQQIIEIGLSVIPEHSEYTRMTRAVMAFHKEHPDNWRDGFQFVKANFGYDRYPGHCHIMPNSAVIVLSMLYGEGDFDRTINICNMCGWDTDCNVGNVGTILGVLVGLDGIDESWRKPINDFLCCSSVIGTLNLLTLPWCASYIANFGYKIAEQKPPVGWEDLLENRGPRFHFEYPGSTHAFKADVDNTDTGWAVSSFLMNSDEQAASGTRSLKVIFDGGKGGDGHRVYYKTYYRPHDFDDSRYDPSFSPQIYPGQTVTTKLFVPAFTRGRVFAQLFVKDGNTGVRHYSSRVELSKEQWHSLTYEIPYMANVCLEEVGVEITPELHGTLSLYLDDFDFYGKPNYEISFAHERLETWSRFHIAVSQFTWLRGIWTLEEGLLSGSYSGETAECYTGDLQWADYRLESDVIPVKGASHRIQFRVQGGLRSYAASLDENNRIVLLKNDGAYRELASAHFEWKLDREYRIAVKAVGHSFTLYVDGEELLSYQDDDHPYLTGQIGLSNAKGSHTHYRGFSVTGL